MHSNAKFLLRPHILLAALVAPTAFASPAAGQSASIGADVVSRYVWRGLDFGESLSVQPALTFGAGGLEVGAWGSYSISASGAGANENDLWATYTFEAGSGGSFSLGVTDYYFPAPDAELGFVYSDSHTLELSVAFSGPETFPVSFYGGILARNDPDNSVYIEASYPFVIEDVDLGIHFGGVSGASSFYDTEGRAVVNVGITASKALQITDRFAPPVSVSYIFNPDQDRAFLVFGLSLAP